MAICWDDYNIVFYFGSEFTLIKKPLSFSIAFLDF